MSAWDDTLNELIADCSKAGIEVVSRPEGLVVQGVELPKQPGQRRREFNPTFRKLVDHVNGKKPVAVTPTEVEGFANEKAQRAWLTQFGFVENSGTNLNQAFEQQLILPALPGLEVSADVERAANGMSQDASRELAERAAGIAAVARLQPDYLQRHHARFRGDGARWIGCRAGELGRKVAGKPKRWLDTRLARAEKGLSEAPRFGDLAGQWGGRAWERAARVMAVEGEMDRRGLGQIEGERQIVQMGSASGSGSPEVSRQVRVPSRYEWLLDGFKPAARTWLEARANELRDQLEKGRDDKALLELQRTLGTVEHVFRDLDRHPGEAAAWDVAIRRELSAQELTEAAKTAAQETGVDGNAVVGSGETLEESVRKCRLYLGEERAGVILEHAQALVPSTRAMGKAAVEMWAASRGNPLEELDVKHALASSRAEVTERAKVAELAKLDNPQSDQATALREPIGNLRLAQRKLVEEGVHPALWVAAHGDAAARTIAAQFVRDEFRQQELSKARDQDRGVDKAEIGVERVQVASPGGERVASFV